MRWRRWGSRTSSCGSWDWKDEGVMLDGGMARNAFLARKLSKMPSSDLCKLSYSALLLSAGFINDFQGGLPPHGASWEILRCSCSWLLWGILWALSWHTTYIPALPTPRPLSPPPSPGVGQGLSRAAGPGALSATQGNGFRNRPIGFTLKLSPLYN